MAEIQQNVLKTLRPSDALQRVNQGNRRTHGFKLDYKEIDERFVGSFVVHYPSQMEKLQIGVLKAQLLGGIIPMDTNTDNIATIISTLDVVLDQKPEWFDIFDDMLEYEILEAVFIEYIEWVNSFRKRPTTDNPERDSEDQ